MKRSLYFTLIFMLFVNVLQAQIVAPTADGIDVTKYTSFSEVDDVFIFCAPDSSSEIGYLRVKTKLEGAKTFLWEKYNELSASFESYSQESTDDSISVIHNLPNGCYRSTITQDAVTEIDRAWVFNDWTTVDGYVSDSNCESFRLNGEFKTAELTYYDLSDNTELYLFKDVKVEWLEGGEIVSSLLNLQFYDPPYEDTEYTLHVNNKFGCGASQAVLYESIVPKATFSVNPEDGEGPLTVTFSNDSKNGSASYYEWFFYRDVAKITAESEGATEPVDSIMFVAYDDDPVYTYENSGAYLVKLVSKHVSEFYTCVDTFTLEDLIIVDTSFVEAPNVFTPNGDGTNDNFVVKFWSMKSIEISIFNRWGRRVHYWESGNVQGFEDTYSETVWNGKIGGRYASPGVYFFDVVGRGRDGEKRKEHGFVHLFR